MLHYRILEISEIKDKTKIICEYKIRLLIMKVTIIDYGLGNTKSILNACKSFSDSVTISRDPYELKKSSHIIMPGVGSLIMEWSYLINQI